jgi:hypothetical protein
MAERPACRHGGHDPGAVFAVGQELHLCGVDPEVPQGRRKGGAQGSRGLVRGSVNAEVRGRAPRRVGCIHDSCCCSICAPLRLVGPWKVGGSRARDDAVRALRGLVGVVVGVVARVGERGEGVVADDPWVGAEGEGASGRQIVVCPAGHTRWLVVAEWFRGGGRLVEGKIAVEEHNVAADGDGRGVKMKNLVRVLCARSIGQKTRRACLGCQRRLLGLVESRERQPDTQKGVSWTEWTGGREHTGEVMHGPLELGGDDCGRRPRGKRPRPRRGDQGPSERATRRPSRGSCG